MVELATQDMLADYIRCVRFDMLDEKPGKTALHPPQFE
jgi:hypothetical protein